MHQFQLHQHKFGKILLALIFCLMVITLACPLWYNLSMKRIIAPGVGLFLWLWMQKPTSVWLMVPHLSHPHYAAWCKCNSMVLAWLFNSLTKDIQPSVIYFKTAREVWMDLLHWYSKGNGPRIFELRKEVSSLAQDDSTINAYYTRFKGVWDEFSNINQNNNSDISMRHIIWWRNGKPMENFPKEQPLWG